VGKVTTTNWRENGQKPQEAIFAEDGSGGILSVKCWGRSGEEIMLNEYMRLASE
jgi:hypothetical protein